MFSTLDHTNITLISCGPPVWSVSHVPSTTTSIVTFPVLSFLLSILSFPYKFLLLTKTEYLFCLLVIFNIICRSLCIATSFIPSSISFIYRTEGPFLIVSWTSTWLLAIYITIIYVLSPTAYHSLLIAPFSTSSKLFIHFLELIIHRGLELFLTVLLFAWYAHSLLFLHLWLKTKQNKNSRKLLTSNFWIELTPPAIYLSHQQFFFWIFILIWSLFLFSWKCTNTTLASNFY